MSKSRVTSVFGFGGFTEWNCGLFNRVDWYYQSKITQSRQPYGRGVPVLTETSETTTAIPIPRRKYYLVIFL
jgi:hypothetical protein